MLLELKKRVISLGVYGTSVLVMSTITGLIPLSSMSVTQESHGCVTFQLSKNVKVPFSYSQTRFTAPFHMIHTDVWGPAPVASDSGPFDFVTFIDDYSRVTWVFI